MSEASSFDHIESLNDPLRAQLRADPNNPKLHYQAGDEHRRSGRLEAALVAFAAAARLAPQVAVAHFQVGNASYALNKLDDAVAAYQRSFALDAQADTANNLGNALARLNRLDEAIASFQSAAHLNPEFLPAQVNLGQAHLTRGEFQLAMNALMPVLSRNPKHPKAQSLLAEALLGLGNVESAADCYARAVETSPDDVDLRIVYGATLTRLGRFKEAAEQYTLGLQRRHDDPILFNNLGEVNRARGQITESLFCFYKALELNPNLAETHSNMLLTMQYDASVSSEQLLNESRFWAQRHTAGVTRLPKLTGRDRNPARRLRVGFVSADLGRHPVGRFLEPVLKHRDPAELETFCYSVGRINDEQTEALRAAADHWITAGSLSPQVLAERIRAEELDILFDLAGHTADNRLLTFAAKPAPIQISWAGYSGTTGLPEIDYVLADRWCIPKDEEQYFTERVLRLPECYVTFTPPEPDVPVGPLPALTNKHITFGSFNNLAKVTPEVVQLWADTLRAVPGSKLFLKTKALGDAGVRDNVVRMFAERFVSADRLRLEGSAPRAELLAAYNEVDLGLDPFPFNGGITTLESLWMGVPVVSLRGNRFVAHATESFLRNAGLEDWTTSSRADYLTFAQTQTADLTKLAAVRSGLRPAMQNSPLLDAKRFAKEFAAAMRKAWQTWCAAK